MKTCIECILPETFPGISFDGSGRCSQCRAASGKRDRLAGDKAAAAARFEDVLASRVRATAEHRAYDALIAYSGGKDSTYTLVLLRRKYGLRVLAVSLDNGFVSDAARANIRVITDSLGVDHLFFKPRWDLLKRIFTIAAERELFAKKTLERASTICTACIGLVKSFCLRTAIEQEIPLVAFGWSPGQAPLESAIMKNNPALIRAAQQAIRNPLSEIAGSEIDAYFLDARHYSRPELFPTNIHPMAWEYYDEAMILDEIKKLGWTLPKDTDSNSTNCLLNAFANDVHLRRYGFHPYVWEIANMVRDGVMTRDEGYEKIYGEQQPGLLRFARERLGITE